MNKVKIYFFLQILFICYFIVLPPFYANADGFGFWSSAGTNNEARDSFSSVKLSSGKVIVTGGRTTSYTQAVTEYNPVTNSWSNKASMKDGRYDHTANVVKVNGGAEQVLVTGGHGGSTGWPGAFLNTAELYNPTTNTWTYTANNMVSPHAYHTSTLLNSGKVLVAGGYISGSGRTNAVDIYDPISNFWSAAAYMPEEKAFQTATVLDDKRIFIVGGQNAGGNSSSTTAFYDPSINTWISGPSLKTPRLSHQTVLLNDGRVMAIGGTTIGGGSLYSTEIWSPITNTWTDGAPMNYRRTGHTATLLQNGKVLVTGGTGGLQGANNAVLSSAEIYDPATNQWHVTDPMVIPRRGHAATLLNNGSVLVVDGLSTNGLTNTSEIYTPVIPTPTPSPTVIPTSTPIPTLTPTPSPTETPSPTPTPSPKVLGDSTVAPFLDLPFDYRGDFNKVAFNPESWFDHMYPLQNVDCCLAKVLKYTGIEEDVPYRSHAGYDYASKNGVEYGSAVLAAASGSATFVPSNESGGLGDLIKINHGNGYQTWYGHLDPQGLIVSTSGVTAHVERGQKIGETGFTGNVYPKNKYGAHIHFGVFKDANTNDTFADDYPYGLVDPLGWEGTQTDPWTEYESNGRHGAKSSNLFTKKPKPFEKIITTVGGSTDLQNIHITVPQNAYPTAFTIKGNISSYESQDNLVSAAPSFYLYAFNSLGQSFTNFFEPVHILYDYASAELTNIKESSLKLYYFNTETRRLEALPSTVDSSNKTVSATTTHFTYFALMGELRDTVAPTTESVINGGTVSLLAVDNEGGSGVKDTVYTVNGIDWFDYSEQLIFEEEGDYTITYQSRDMSGNLEDQKKVTFSIDKTSPISSAGLFGTEGENGWYVSDVLFSLSAQDAGAGIDRIEYSLDDGLTYVPYTAPVLFTSDGEREVLYRSVDKAGNMEEARSIKLTIDKTAPSTLIYTTGASGYDHWYRSDVSVAFSADDQVSGYSTTYYSLGNTNNFVEFGDPILLTNEGEKKIFYYSVDQAGNVENQKELDIHIDKTFPEATLRYDTGVQDLVISGVDSSETQIVTQLRTGDNREQVTIQDKAGNKLIMQDIDRVHGPNAVLGILTLSYNGAMISPDSNKLSIRYQLDRTNKIKTFEQKYEVKGSVKVLVSYDYQNNKTTITQGKQKTVVDGMKLLQLNTDKGAVRYSINP